MRKLFYIPTFFSIFLFLLTGFALAGEPKTFGIKTGKSLFDIKNKVLPETRVSSPLEPIGLDVKVAPHKDEENILDVKDFSPLDRAGSFFKDKNKRVRSAEETAKELYKAIELGDLEDAKRLQIGIDIRARLDFGSALKVLNKLIPYEVSWVEEPIQFENVEVLGKLANKTNIPISTGEQLYNRWEFQRLFEQKAISIVQPDICHAGGLSELKKISQAAETYYVSVAPHNSNGPISTVASLHLDMSIPNCYKQEIFVSFIEGYKKVLTNNINIENGFATIPDGPGWGTDIDEEALKEFPTSKYISVESEPYKDFF